MTQFYVPLAVFLAVSAVSAWEHIRGRSPAQRSILGWSIDEADDEYAGCRFSLASLLALPLAVALWFALGWWFGL